MADSKKQNFIFLDPLPALNFISHLFVFTI